MKARKKARYKPVKVSYGAKVIDTTTQEVMGVFSCTRWNVPWEKARDLAKELNTSIQKQ